MACLTRSVIKVLLSVLNGTIMLPIWAMVNSLCTMELSSGIYKIFIPSFSLSVFEWTSLFYLKLMIALYIGLPPVYDSLFLKVLPLLMTLAGLSLCSLCKSLFQSPLLLIFRHNSKFNLFDFNPDVVVYFVSHSTILRALIYTISWLCRKYLVASQIEWDSMCGNYAAGI